MTSIQNEAIGKIGNEEVKSAGDKAKAVSGAVKEALIDFCRQSEVFAEAVVNGGSLEECCKEIMNGVGNSISDAEVYARAVKHYLDGATVEVTMKVNTDGSGKQTAGSFDLSLADLIYAE